jgi:imidazolonepropionase-like amidohydrolase
MGVHLRNGNIIDGNGQSIRDASVLIQEDRITGIGKALEVPPGTKIIDCTGKTVMPGLIDAHVHLCLDASPDPENRLRTDTDFTTTLRSARHAQCTVMGGITSVRDLGAKSHIDVALRGAIQEGTVEGPRLMVSGKPIVMTGGTGWFFGREADGEAEIRKAAREQWQRVV